MRIILGVILALTAAKTADAQSKFAGAGAPRGSEARLASALNAAAFAAPQRTTAASGAAFAFTPLPVPTTATAAAGNASLAEAARYDSSHGVATRVDAQQIVLPSGRTGAVDSLRLTLATPSLIPGLGPRDLAGEAFQADAYDVTLTRGWPQAVKFAAGDLNVDFTPHAGLGYGDFGGSAEAGAVVRVGQGLEDRVSDALGSSGVKDGKTFGNRDRWYLFAAASGKAVGLNMLRQDGDWSRAGWSQDPTSSLVGDAQVGLGWRRGSMQTSFGYIHRTIKAKEAVMGMESKDDSMVAFSFSLKPHN